MNFWTSNPFFFGANWWSQNSRFGMRSLKLRFWICMGHSPLFSQTATNNYHQIIPDILQTRIGPNSGVSDSLNRHWKHKAKSSSNSRTQSKDLFLSCRPQMSFRCWQTLSAFLCFHSEPLGSGLSCRLLPKETFIEAFLALTSEIPWILQWNMSHLGQ
jgi:hypothetical protein